MTNTVIQMVHVVIHEAASEPPRILCRGRSARKRGRGPPRRPSVFSRGSRHRSDAARGSALAESRSRVGRTARVEEAGVLGRMLPSVVEAHGLRLASVRGATGPPGGVEAVEGAPTPRAYRLPRGVAGPRGGGRCGRERGRRADRSKDSAHSGTANEWLLYHSMARRERGRAFSAGLSEVLRGGRCIPVPYRGAASPLPRFARRGTLICATLSKRMCRPCDAIAAPPRRASIRRPHALSPRRFSAPTRPAWRHHGIERETACDPAPGRGAFAAADQPGAARAQADRTDGPAPPPSGRTLAAVSTCASRDRSGSACPRRGRRVPPGLPPGGARTSRWRSGPGRGRTSWRRSSGATWTRRPPSSASAPAATAARRARRRRRERPRRRHAAARRRSVPGAAGPAGGATPPRRQGRARAGQGPRVHRPAPAASSIPPSCETRSGTGRSRAQLRRRTVYQTRHSFASNALAAGESPSWVAAQLGHATAEMLFKVYARFIPNRTRRDGSALLGGSEHRYGDDRGTEQHAQ